MVEKGRWVIILLVGVVLVASACSRASGSGEALGGTDVGPQTRDVKLSDYQEIRYISQRTGSDTSGDGSSETPWQSIGRALLQITDAGPEKRYAVLVGEGVYRGDTPLEMKAYVDLYGGFNAVDWSRNLAVHPSVLDGEGTHRVLLGADHATLDGFTVRSGAVRGKGGGLLAEGVSPTITNNVFIENRTLKPIPWQPAYWHETAYDGGAIACLNGCSAIIENNLFVRNTTEIGRGAGVACDNEATKERKATPRVANNVFIANVTSAGADSMRSGDGGAISFYGYCDGKIVNNVVANNKAANRNDGGGVFVALWSAPEIRENFIVGNVAGDDGGGLFIGGQKHHYDTPKDPVPLADSFFVHVTNNVIMGNQNRSGTSGGARLTMMMRGRFANNVVAESPGGVYFQRSELIVEHNTIIGGVRYEDERREAPGPVVFRNNIIRGHRNWVAPVTEKNNLYEDPRFEKDGFVVTPAEVTYETERFVTRLYVEGAGYTPDALSKRVVQVGDRWSAIASNDEEHILVWGDFSGEETFTVKPSHHLSKNSPCIDQGIAMDILDHDMDGDPRALGGAPDIGADEYRGG